MPRFMSRKAKQMSVPLTDPMASVIQEINGEKAKKTKMLATPQLGKAANTKKKSSSTEVAQDLAATNVLIETKTKTDTVEKPSSFIRSTTKPKQLSLDPMELQSITNLQNWCPLIRNPANEGKTECKTMKTCTSQRECPDESKSVLPTVKLTQYKPVVWNPPLRRNISTTETSATPAKRAKICEADKPDLNSKDKGKEMLESSNNRQTLNQIEDYTVSHNASKPTNTTGNFEVENPQSLNEQKETSQQVAISYAKISCPERSETNENFISYSPMEDDENQQVLIEDLPKKNVVGVSSVASSQNSEEDMFLSQEPSEENLLTESPNPNPPKNTLASKKEETCRENLNADLNATKNTKPNSIAGMFCKEVNPSQESSDKDMFEAENQSEDHFDENWITEVAKLKTASQRSSDEGVFGEKIKDNKVDSEEDMLHFEKKITPLINLDTPHCENQQSNPGCKSPPIGKVDVDAQSDLIASTPPRQFEMDIFSCPTAKRVCIENQVTLPSLEMNIQLPEISEDVCAAIDTVAVIGCTENPITPLSLSMGNQLPEIPEDVCTAIETVAVDVAQEKEIQPCCISGAVNVIAKMVSHDESVIANSVNDIVNLKHVTEALELTNDLPEMAVNVGEADINDSECAFHEEQHAKSQLFTIISDNKDLVGSLVQKGTKNISEKTVGQENVSKALHLAQDKKTETEEQLQLNVDNNLTKDDYKNDDSSINVDRMWKEVDISSANEKRNTAFEETIKPNNFPPNEIVRDQINSEIQGLDPIGEHKISPEAEIGSPKLIANEKASLETIYVGEENLSQKENSDCQRNSEIQGLQIDCKDKISQAAEIESKKPIENYIVLSDSSRRNSQGDGNKTDRKEERNKMKPYTYEIEQDFDISQSQLIEIERAIMRESRQPGPVGRIVLAEGIPRVAGRLPRVADTAPGLVSGTCGEAQTPSFSMPSLPPIPTLNWKKKVQDDRQKLRAVIHEISRLNAMLMSVRREVWPVAGVNPEAPPLNDVNRQGPGPSGRRY